MQAFCSVLHLAVVPCDSMTFLSLLAGFDCHLHIQVMQHLPLMLIFNDLSACSTGPYH